MRVEVVERDLVDEYHRNELATEDRRRFETHYLSSPIRREKAGFGEALREYVEAGSKANHIRAETTAETKPSWFNAWWKIGFAAAAAAILVGVAIPLWFKSSKQQASNPPSNNIGNDSPSSNQQAARSEPDQVQDRPVVAPEVRPNDIPVNTNVKPANNDTVAPPARVFALSLSPQMRGLSGEKRVSIPSDTERLAVTLRLEPTEYKSVQVELKDHTSGRSVWQGRARPSGSGAYQSVRFQIPRRLLAPGSYGVVVTGAAKGFEPEIIGDYTFRVVR